MTKIMISILLLCSVKLSAGLLEDAITAHNKGNITSANKFYLQACKHGSTKGCLKSGIFYYTGEGVKKNVKKAKKLFVKACKQSNPQACYYAGSIYKRGAKGVERDFKRARIYFAAGCKMRLPKSCKEYNLIREKRQIVGKGNNDHNFSYTYTTDVYGG